MKMKTMARTLAAISVCVAAFAQPATAASVSYYLNQSNVDSFLPDGTNYLMVTISDSTTYVGDIEFRVEILGPLSSIAGSNFGIQSFGFNSTQTLTGANIAGLPTNWGTALNTNQDGFGNFDFVENGSGSNRVDPLTFRVTGISGDTLADYAVLSTGNAGQGAAFFAAHVAGFNDVDPGTGEITSGYFGGSMAVPVPAAVWLLGSGLLGLAGVARRRR